MYGDRHTSEYNKGMHNFLEVVEANKQNGFMCCSCTECGNTRSYSNRKILHSHLLYKGFIIVGHETGLKQVDVNGFLLRVIPIILTTSTWTRHQTICALVCLSRKRKSMHAINELGRASIIVHPLPTHLHYTTPKIPN